MLQKHCERPLGSESTSSLFVPCNGTQRWQTFMESRVRKLMLSWEKTFLSPFELQGNSSSTQMGILDLSPSPAQWIISPLTQLLVCSCSHQKQKENILPPLGWTWPDSDHWQLVQFISSWPEWREGGHFKANWFHFCCWQGNYLILCTRLVQVFRTQVCVWIALCSAADSSTNISSMSPTCLFLLT